MKSILQRIGDSPVSAAGGRQVTQGFPSTWPNGGGATYGEEKAKRNYSVYEVWLVLREYAGSSSPGGVTRTPGELDAGIVKVRFGLSR